MKHFDKVENTNTETRASNGFEARKQTGFRDSIILTIMAATVLTASSLVIWQMF